MLHHLRGLRHAAGYHHRLAVSLRNKAVVGSDATTHNITQLYRRMLSSTTSTTGTTCPDGQEAGSSTSSSPKTSAKQIGYSHDGYMNTTTSNKTPIYERTYGPDKTLLPKSRKPVPYKVASRNTTGPYEAKGWALPFYPKRKHARKRTTGLLNALTSEEALRMVRDGRACFASQLGRPKPGQILRVGYVTKLDEEEMKWFAGVVMVVRNKLLGASVILRNVVQGVAVERCFPLFSPLVKEVKVIGQRRVTRNKMYFLREKALRESTFGNALDNPNYEKKKKKGAAKHKKNK